MATGFLLLEIGCDSMAFMDDILALKGTMFSMQAFVNWLLPNLREAGLELQPSKCQLLYSGDVGNKFLDLDGFRLQALPPDQHVSVLNFPVGLGVSDADFLGQAVDKARGKFQATRGVLCSGAPLRARLGILDKVVWGSLRWMVGCLYPSPRLQQMLNTFQIECVKIMLKQRWNGQGLFTAFDIQCRRNARYILYQQKGLRWGDEMLRVCWKYLGHRTRNGYSTSSSIAGILTHFRGLAWWTRQQGLGSGERHRGRFFPQKTGVLVPLIGSSQKVFGNNFVAKMKTSWSSGRQPALQF